MAFNKGLQLNDSDVGAGNDAVRDSIALGGQSIALFQTQLVNSAKQAHGATVFTIRPSDNDDSAGDYQSLLVGQNFAIGIEYNTAGDEYRLVIQSREDYDVNAGTETPAFGSWVATEVETTFGVNLNDNGTITYMHNGSGAQSLSIPTFTPKTATTTLTETASTAATPHIVLDDGRGNLVEIIAPATAGGSSGDIVDALKDYFDGNVNGLSAEQQSGYTLTVQNTNELVIARTDGAGFTVSAGGTMTAAHLEHGAGPSDLVGNPVDVSGAQNYLFDLDFDGFVSQIATFNAPLTVSELSGYVNQPNTIPETLVNSDGEEAVALLTSDSGAGTALTAADVYTLDFDDTNGNAIQITYTLAAGETAWADLATGLKANFNALTDKKGFAFDDSVDDQIKISRADGADFKITGTAIGANEDLKANGVTLANGASTVTYSSTSIVPATLTIEEIADPAGDDVGAVYEIVLERDGGDPLTLNGYLTSGVKVAGDAADLFNATATTDGYAFSGSAGTNLVITRADGQNFSAKLGANDEAANFDIDSVALTKDSSISSTNGVRSGVTNTISNKVVQNFDFTTLADAEEVTAKADANYAGADTLDIFGMDKSDGTSLLKLGSTANAYDGVDSSGYTGAVAASSGDKIVSDVLYTQLRDVEQEGANREYTVDVFIDPYRVTDGDFGALSYTIDWGTDGLKLLTLTQLDSTGGYKLADIDTPTNGQADVRWFKPGSITDFSSPIASLVFEDVTGTVDPTFTFTSVDIDGVDFTDDVTYSASFTDTHEATLVNLGDTLKHGNDSDALVEDQLVIVSGAPGATAANPAPTSGLYLTLADHDQDASTDSPNVDYRFNVQSSTATNTVSFEIDLPALADTSVNPETLVNNTTFVLDAALADWNLTTAEVQGRTLVVEASGVTNLAVGATIGQFSTTIIDGFDTTQFFDMVNVQTDSDAANESGRGLYVAATRTNSEGKWEVADMPIGTMTREYVGSAEIASNAVSALDAYYALQLSAGLQPNWWGGTFQEGQAIAADFDGSGKVTAADALAILNYSVGNVPDVDPVSWVFFDTETSAIVDVNTVDELATLKSNTGITSAADNLALGQGDEVVLVGDLSDPSA